MQVRVLNNHGEGVGGTGRSQRPERRRGRLSGRRGGTQQAVKTALDALERVEDELEGNERGNHVGGAGSARDKSGAVGTGA